MGLKRGVILYQPEKVAPKREALSATSYRGFLSPILLALTLSLVTASRYYPFESSYIEDSTLDVAKTQEVQSLPISDLEARLATVIENTSEEEEIIETQKTTLRPQISRPVVLENKSTIVEPSRFVRAYEAPKIQNQRRAPSALDLSVKVGEIIRKHGKKGINVEELSKKIVLESISQKYDPLFVAAVIKSESAFNKLATSGVGAKGLMQIMPATGKFIEELKDFESVIGGKLTDPGYNVKLGITYLKHLDELFKGNRVFTLTAYNWGPGRMEDAFNGKRKIPKDVMNYALKILGDHEKWRNQMLTKMRNDFS